MTEIINEDAYQENVSGLTRQEILANQTPEYLRAEIKRVLGSLGLLTAQYHELNDALHGEVHQREAQEFIG